MGVSQIPLSPKTIVGAGRGDWWGVILLIFGEVSAEGNVLLYTLRFSWICRIIQIDWRRATDCTIRGYGDDII